MQKYLPLYSWYWRSPFFTWVTPSTHLPIKSVKSWILTRKLSKTYRALTKGLKVEELLALAEHVSDLAPQVLNTVDEVRKTMDDVNQTVASVDNKIPAILDEVKNVRMEVEQVRTDVIPPTLTELKRYRVDVMPPMLSESKSYREQTIPVIVAESEMLRAEVPGILAQANLLADKSKELAQGAAEGAVKGVVLSPFNLLRDAGDGIKTRVQSEFEPTLEAE